VIAAHTVRCGLQCLACVSWQQCERGLQRGDTHFQACQRGCRQAVETLGVLKNCSITPCFHITQDPGDRLFDGGIGGIVKLQ